MTKCLRKTTMLATVLATMAFGAAANAQDIGGAISDILQEVQRMERSRGADTSGLDTAMLILGGSGGSSWTDPFHSTAALPGEYLNKDWWEKAWNSADGSLIPDTYFRYRLLNDRTYTVTQVRNGNEVRTLRGSYTYDGTILTLASGQRHEETLKLIKRSSTRLEVVDLGTDSKKRDRSWLTN